MLGKGKVVPVLF